MSSRVRDRKLVALCGDRVRNARLTADGIPRGGRYEWTITRGSDKVGIVGSSRRKNVRLKPKWESVVKNDVEIKVTYTKRGTRCEGTKKLTVFTPMKLRDRQTLRTLTGARRGYVRIVRYTVLDQFGDDLTEAGFKPRED